MDKIRELRGEPPCRHLPIVAPHLSPEHPPASAPFTLTVSPSEATTSSWSPAISSALPTWRRILPRRPAARPDLTVKADLKRVEDRLRSDRSVTALVNNA